MKEWDADLDEHVTFAYGKDVATREAVRFKTTTQILRFVRTPGMEQKSKQDDEKIIYINQDIVKAFEEITRDRQISELIRMIIEFEGNTDGETTRKSIMAHANAVKVNINGPRWVRSSMTNGSSLRCCNNQIII